MARFRLLMVAALALGLFVSSAEASNCARDDYDHNGSLMEWEICDGGTFVISYVEPRSGLIAVGVKSGTVLVDGTEREGGVVSGTARRFSKTCGPLAYAVTGHNRGNMIVLNGNAPKVDTNCRVTGYRTDNLLFTLKSAALPAAQPDVVTPSCPPGYVLSGASCVAENAAPSGGDWYAIAGSFGSRGEAEQRADRYGGGWVAINTNTCPNLKDGLWIAAAGPFDKATAQSYATRSGGYLKTCH